MKNLKLIACVDKNFGIGRDGHLLFDLRDDIREFRWLTSGGVLIMGRKTWESLPSRPLGCRTNTVVSTQDPFDPLFNRARVVPDIKAALGDAAFWTHPDNPKATDVWVIGGGEIYRQMIPYCEEAYITHVDADGHGDTFLEGWNPDEWEFDRVGAVSDGSPSWVQKIYRRKS